MATLVVADCLGLEVDVGTSGQGVGDDEWR